WATPGRCGPWPRPTAPTGWLWWCRATASSLPTAGSRVTPPAWSGSAGCSSTSGRGSATARAGWSRRPRGPAVLGRPRGLGRAGALARAPQAEHLAERGVLVAAEARHGPEALGVHQAVGRQQVGSHVHP